MKFRALERLRAMDRAFRALDALVPPMGIVLPDALVDTIPALIPKYQAPHHLAPLLDALERAPYEELREVVHVFPRAGKTESILVAIAKHLKSDPTIPFMYFAHNDTLARSKSARARALAREAGVRIAPESKSKTEWLTVDANGKLMDGGLRAFSIEGGATGHGARVIIIDDPFSGRTQAESPRERDRVWDTILSTVTTRLEPGGSVFIVMQRWHEDDAAGRAVREGWHQISITPFDGRGRSIWPERFSDDHWARVEATLGPYFWSSQYLGNPRSRDERVFADVTLCDANEVPADGIDAIGVDLAHSNTSRSDPHALVVMRRVGDTFWITDCESRKCPLTSEGERMRGFTAEVQERQRRHAGARTVMYFGGREDVMLNLLSKLPEGQRVRIEAIRASADKFLRSQPLAAAWRAGKVKVVRSPWTDKLVSQFMSFHGGANGVDDVVDAACVAFDALARGGPRGRARGTGDGGVLDRLGPIAA